jgi:hypothetical protein
MAKKYKIRQVDYLFLWLCHLHSRAIREKQEDKAIEIYNLMMEIPLPWEDDED